MKIRSEYSLVDFWVKTVTNKNQLLHTDKKTSALLEDLHRLLSAEGTETYLVGGFLRNLVLKKPTADIDLCVIGNGFSAASKISRHFKATQIVLDADNDVTRVMLPGFQLDISGTPDISANLARRDFNLNAMAAPLSALNHGNLQIHAIVDPMQGLRDIKNRVIRVTSSEVFRADPIRLIRAIRLSAELGFELDEQTQSLITTHAGLISTVAGERIREELLKLLETSQTGIWEKCLELGLLLSIFTELDPCYRHPQPYEHTWDVLEHSIKTIYALDAILGKSVWPYQKPEITSEIYRDSNFEKYFIQQISGTSRIRTLAKLAALLHDIAKPQTRSTDPDGRVRFTGHPLEGSRITSEILTRLRFSKKEISLVEKMVCYHLRPVQMNPDGQLPSSKAIYRYFRDLSEAATATLYLSLADHLATDGPNLMVANWQEHVNIVAHILSEQKRQLTRLTPKRLITGTDLIERFALRPGPRIKILLGEIAEAQAAGEIKTRREAFKFISQRLGGKPENNLN